jgi:ABC-type transport system involved in multi-copper enzyme maturation permease subunit
MYLAIFFSLGVFISAISPTTGNAAMRCLFVWLLVVLVIPNVTPHIAQRFIPTPSTQEMERKYDTIIADTSENRVKDHAEASKRVSNTKPVEYEEYRRILRRIRKEIEDIEYRHLTRQRDVLRQLANAHGDRLQRQMWLTAILSSCSPYAVFADVATTLANTGGESQVDFLKQTRRYEDDYFYQQYVRGLETGAGIHRYNPVHDPLAFEPTFSDLQKRMRQCLPGIGLLVFSGILCFMAGYLLFLRRPI